jgi:hypothetical protein
LLIVPRAFVVMERAQITPLGKFEDKFHELLVRPGHLDVRALQAVACFGINYSISTRCILRGHEKHPTLSIYEEVHKYLPDNKFGRLQLKGHP